MFIVDIPGHRGEEMRKRNRITVRERTRPYIGASNVTTTASHHVIACKVSKQKLPINYSSIYVLYIVQLSANLEV